MFIIYISVIARVSYFFFLMIRRPPRSTLDRSSAASDVYKRQGGILKRKWVVTDASGNTASCEQHFHVITEVPWMCPDPLVELTCKDNTCLLYTSPSPRDRTRSRMPSSA